METLGNATFENYIGLTQGYSEMAYQMTAHVLTLGYSVMFAGLLYFVLTIKNAAPKYQISSVISGVLLGNLAQTLSRAEGYVYHRPTEKQAA